MTRLPRRALVPRERGGRVRAALREFAALATGDVLPEAGFVALADLARELFAEALRGVLDRLDPAAEDLALAARGLRPLVVFLAVVRAAGDLVRALLFLGVPLEDDVDDAELLVPDEKSIAHLPVITRCAASATASAINEPSLVALAMTLDAA